MERDPTDRVTRDVIRVEFPEDEHVVRVDVESGDTVVLPFDSDAELQMKTGSGHLAIRDDRDHDHTVILQGFAKAADDPLHAVIVESSDGAPIDVATVLAATDPELLVECACGPSPADEAGANTGGIFQVFEGGSALSGFEAIGHQQDSAGLLGLAIPQHPDLLQ